MTTKHENVGLFFNITEHIAQIVGASPQCQNRTILSLSHIAQIVVEPF